MAATSKKRIGGMANQGCTPYLGAIVLGLNDAIVELTGALAGFTMALPNNKLIILAGFTTGVAATLSMAAAEFLSQQADPGPVNSYLAAMYTGATYLVTVAILLLPFFILPTPLTALALCLAFAAFLITVFTYITSRIRGTKFWHDFIQMLGISFGVAAIAFGISWGAKCLWGIEV